jgi:hypothetical protein
MKNAITASVLAPEIGATIRDIENWIARLDLKTKYHSPDQGKPRLLSKLNCLELGFIAGVVRGGARPSKAVLFAARFLDHWSPLAIGGGRRNWFVFPSGDLKLGDWSDSPDLNKLKSKFRVTTLSCVDIGEIVRRVDALFSEAA